MRAAPEHRQPQTVRHAQTPRTSTSPLPIDKTQTTVHTSTNNPPTLQETRTQTMGRARRTPTPPYVGVKTFIFDLDHQRQCLVEHGHVSWSMVVFICDHGGIRGGDHLWQHLVEHDGVDLWQSLVGHGSAGCSSLVVSRGVWPGLHRTVSSTAPALPSSAECTCISWCGAL
jgi:hypothetical protein